MLDVFNQNSNNFRLNPDFLASFLLGSDLSSKKNQTEELINDFTKQSNTSELDKKEFDKGGLELIYAEDGEDNYDESMDTDGNKKISYKEYLRYCERNSIMQERLSDTKINHEKRQFTTYSFGHATNAYKRPEFDAVEGKVKGSI